MDADFLSSRWTRAKGKIRDFLPSYLRKSAKSADNSPAFSLPARCGFTLVELLVTITVLALLITFVTQLCNNALWVTCKGNQHMEADEEARAVFDRMAIDLAQLVQREDVDYWLKDPDNAQPGNDQLAFYSQVPGYYPSNGSQSPVSLVAYRVDAQAGLQRLGCGLVWNGVPGTAMPMVFSPQSASSGLNTLAQYWPTATNGAADDRYEPAGPQVFRMEYYYVLKSDGSAPALLSAVPWDTRSPALHASVRGMKDVAALGVVLAVIDAKTETLVSKEALSNLAAAMGDFSDATAAPGALETQWQNAIAASGLPRAVVSSIRVYRRWLHLPSASQPNL